MVLSDTCETLSAKNCCWFQPVTEDAISLVDDVFYDEPLPGSAEYDPSRLDKIREESEVTEKGERYGLCVRC